MVTTRNKHIFIVEDDDGLASLNSTLIRERDNYEVTTGDDLQCLIELSIGMADVSNPIDVIVVGIGSSETGGFDLIKKIRRIKKYIPIIATSRYCDEEMLTKLTLIGCDDFIYKSYSIESLLKSVEKVIKNKDELVRDKDNVNGKKATYICADNHDTGYNPLLKKLDSEANVCRRFMDNANEGDYNVKVFSRYYHLDKFGGNFFDIRNTRNGCDILVADVAGNDLISSYYSLLMKREFNKNNCVDGVTLFKALNEKFFANNGSSRMVAATMLQIDLKSMSGKLVSAANPAPVKLPVCPICPRPLYAAGDVLGVMEEVSFQIRQFSFQTGDTILMHTDGVANVCRVNKESGITEKLRWSDLDNIIMKHCKRPLNEKVENIWNDIFYSSGYEIYDNMLLLGIEIP